MQRLPGSYKSHDQSYVRERGHHKVTPGEKPPVAGGHRSISPIAPSKLKRPTTDRGSRDISLYTHPMSATETAPPVATSNLEARPRLNPALAIAALGVVFGDIGTSPLYTIKTCFTTAQVSPSLENVLGIISLLLWALAFVVCIKYVGNLMNVDHDGEGGILALLALASPAKSVGMPLRVGWLTIVVIAGAAMLFGDGIITPAISVISAVEGIGVVTKAAQPFIVRARHGALVYGNRRIGACGDRARTASALCARSATRRPLRHASRRLRVSHLRRRRARDDRR
jgi:hypothetical protein